MYAARPALTRKPGEPSLQDDRRLVDAADERVRGRDRVVGRRPWPRITSTSCIIGCSAGLKKWRLTQCCGAAAAVGEEAAEQPGAHRARVRRDERVGRFMPCAERAVELGLDLAVLHARLDHEVAVAEIASSVRRDLHAAELRVEVGLRSCAPFFDRAARTWR